MGKSNKLGGGGRFQKGAAKIEAKEGLSKESADAIMAVAGRKKYGNKAMGAISQRGTSFKDALQSK